MPPMDEATRLVFDCLSDVHTCRQNGFGLGYIPYDAVMLWADRNRLDPDVADMLWGAIKIVDANFVKKEAERLKAESKANQ